MADSPRSKLPRRFAVARCVLLATVVPLGACSLDGTVDTGPGVEGIAAGGGLRGEYYDNADLTSLKLTRTDADVDFDWGTGSPSPLVGADTFSVRWTGQIVPRYSETYTFYTDNDDGVRLWIDGVLVIDNWVHHALSESHGTIALHAGQPSTIRLEYFENTGAAVAQLAWSSASQARQIVPQSALYPSDYATDHGEWAASATLGATATEASMWQAPTVAPGSNYVASIALRGAGSIELEVQAGFWTNSVLARVRCDATDAWTTCAVPAFATGSNTRLTWRVVDAYGTAGRVWIDDTFLGVAGGTDVLGNAGFESGDTVWGGASGAVFAIQQLVGAPSSTPDGGVAAPPDAGAPTGTTVEFARGIYQHDYENAFAPYQSWFGPRPLNIEGSYNGNSSWDSVVAPSWVIGVQSNPIYSWRAWVAADPTHRMINVGTEPFPTSGSLHECATGAYDGYYRTMGSNWVAAGMGHAIFRFAWEEDGNWFQWTIQRQDSHGTWSNDPAKIADYRTCFQHFSRAIHATDPQAIVSWDAGPTSAFDDAVYPGDDVVDQVSRDVYDESYITGGYPFPSSCDTACMATHQALVWNTDIAPVLVGAANFATAHHKPFSLGEWGLASRPNGHGGNDDPDFVQHIYDLMHGRLPGMTQGFVPGYASYFEALADGGTIETRLRSSGAYTSAFPRAAALYHTLFAR